MPIDIAVSSDGVNRYRDLLGILGNGIMIKNNWIFDCQNLLSYYEPNYLSEANFDNYFKKKKPQ